MSEEDEAREPGIHTPEEKMAYWQLCRVAIDLKAKRLDREEALRQFSYWADLPPHVAWMLLQPMSKDKVEELRKGLPDTIGPDPAPKAIKNATRERNKRGRRWRGVDAVGRDIQFYFERYKERRREAIRRASQE